MATHVETIPPISGDFLQVRATASDRLPLGARLPVSWPVVLFAFVVAALVAAWSQVEGLSSTEPAASSERVVERTRSAANRLPPEWTWEPETFRFEEMVRTPH
jgi:hypothetical protein